MVEHQLPKLRVASSILVTRSSKIKPSEDLLNPSEGFLCQVLIVEKSRTIVVGFSSFLWNELIHE
jgi:hypothetical protein